MWGGGIGGFSNFLMRRGYYSTCLVPDESLIIYGKEKFPAVTFLQGSAELFTTHKKFDGAVMIESFQYFSDRKRALDNVVKYLNNKSFILMIEELNVSLSSTVLPREEVIVFLLTEHKFRLKEIIDLTKNILPICAIVAELVQPYSLKFSQQWIRKEREYKEGKMKYKLLLFERE